MTRSLPLQPDAVAEQPSAAIVQVYDPAMCCPTGLCGPGVDPALLAVARDLRWLEAAGIRVARFGLAQAPDAFAANAQVKALLQAHGDGALPVTLVNGTVLASGRYPSRDEVMRALTQQDPQAGGGSANGETPSLDAGSR
jgi:hypothetical protein